MYLANGIIQKSNCTNSWCECYILWTNAHLIDVPADEFELTVVDYANMNDAGLKKLQDAADEKKRKEDLEKEKNKKKKKKKKKSKGKKKAKKGLKSLKVTALICVAIL